MRFSRPSLCKTTSVRTVSIFVGLVPRCVPFYVSGIEILDGIANGEGDVVAAFMRLEPGGSGIVV